MDAYSGRSQTTKGIWLANSPKLGDPNSFIIDLEGSDGRERGEDDNSFERQSSLFALAVADILVVNMWAKDVGREAGAGKPLLKTIFQVNSLMNNTPAFCTRHHEMHLCMTGFEGNNCIIHLCTFICCANQQTPR